MKKSKIIIGANFGDEGKGLATDYFANKNKSLVIRYNGGAQAGHTVVSGNLRHVFSHYGSGTFSNATTALSSHFIVNPILANKERKALESLTKLNKLVIDPRAIVTTPYEMILNQQLELLRGGGRHGSCGVGIGETVERDFILQDSLIASDLQNIDIVKRKLRVIQHEWFPMRAKVLGIEDKIIDIYSIDIVYERFLEEILEFQNHFQTIHQGHWSAYFDNDYIFEGAQGLGLDQNFGHFPNVTRSNTGLKNVVEILADLDQTEISINYITRAYLTRHGSGTLEGELDEKPYSGILEKTNVANTYQGSFRYAHLDIDKMKSRIQQDLASVDLEATVNLFVTCLDQCDDKIKFVENESIVEFDNEEAVSILMSKVKASYVYESRGSSKEFVKKSNFVL